METRLTRPHETQRLKILQIAGWYPSKKNPVAGVFVREHVKATALYNDVVVLYSEGISDAVKGIYEIQDTVEDGIRTLRIRYRKSPVPKTTYFIYLWSMFAAFRKLLHQGFKPDVIHAHVYSAGVTAVLMGKQYRIPVVVSEHWSGFPRGMVRGIERLKAKFAFEQAAIVCPVSNNLRKHIEQLGVRARFQVIPNVVDTSLFSPANGTKKEKNHNPKKLLVVALLSPIKGIPYLLRALSQLRERRNDFVLDIVGDGPYREEYEALVHELGIGDVVFFHGLKPKQEVAEFMRNADFFVLPSEWENLPCVLIEAAASGLPVVATRVGGIPEIVREEMGVVVPPKDVEALKEAIDYMLEHYQEYDREKVSKHAKSRYAYKAVGKRLHGIYESIVENTSQREYLK